MKITKGEFYTALRIFLAVEENIGKSDALKKKAKEALDIITGLHGLARVNDTNDEAVIIKKSWLGGKLSIFKK